MVQLGDPRRPPSALINRYPRIYQTRSTGSRIADKNQPILAKKSAAVRSPAARPDNAPKSGSRNMHIKLHRSIHSNLPLHNYATDHYTISNSANKYYASTCQSSNPLFDTQPCQPVDIGPGKQRQYTKERL
jgi:hypothetical protein